MRKILLALFCVCCYSATAQTLSLNDCLKLASNNNLNLKAAQSSADKSRIMEGTAWDIDNTELSLSQDPTSGASPDNALSLSQTIDFPTRYVARRHQLKAETNSQQMEVAVLNNQLQGKVAALYYRLVYERERFRILQKEDSILANYEEIATKRYNAGETRQLEPLNASRLRHENKLAANMAKTEYANTQAELSRLLVVSSKIEPSETSLTPIGLESNQNDSSLSALPHSLAFDFSQTAEGRLADSKIKVADEMIKVEKTGFLPSLTLSLRTQMVIKGWNPYHVDRGWNDGNFMGFEIGVGIPIFNGATRARVKAARLNREQLQLQANTEIQLYKNQFIMAMNNMLAARDQLEYYMRSGNSNAEESARISDLAYKNGEISYIEYVSALQQSIDTQLKYASAINDYNQAVITLMTLNNSLYKL